MFTLDEIKDLMQTMQTTNLGEMQLQQGDFKIKLTAKSPVAQTVVAAAPVAEVTTVPSAPVVAPAMPEGTLLLAPIVGTFYSAPSPDKAPFVTPGQSVKQGDVLYIIESMKLMNEIKAEQDGVVVDVLVQNGDAVEYDQPIMAIK